MVEEDKKHSNDFSIDDESSEVKDRISAVSNLGGKQKIGLVILFLVCFIAVYYVFSSGKNDEKTKKEKSAVQEKILSQKDLKSNKQLEVVPGDKDSNIFLLPSLPELPKIPDIPTPPRPIEPPKQVVPVVPQLPSIKEKAPVEPPKKTVGVIRNRNTPMLVVSGGVGVNQSQEAKSGVVVTDPSQLLDPKKLDELRKSLQGGGQRNVSEDTELSRTSNQKLATYVGDLKYIISQGKMIDAILETAVSTDLKGKIRAIVSRDVFSESGERILIPKGSRLIGEYSTEISFTQGRVNISWDRIILPWGIDVMIDSFLGVDQLGRAGVGGIVDNKFANVLTTSLMIATIRVAGGVLIDKVMGGDSVTMNANKFKSSTKKSDESDESGTKVKGSPGAILAMQGVNDASKQVIDYINRFADITPVIKINQGTRLKVFVNQDIVFPKSAFSDYNIVN